MDQKRYAYVSSWNHFGGKNDTGLVLYEFDAQTGSLQFVKVLDSSLSCNVTVVDPKRDVLYVLNEVEDQPDALYVGGGGRILAYKIDRGTGDLLSLCDVPSYGVNPCYLTLDATGEYMLVANHASHAVVTQVKKDYAGKYFLSAEYDDAPIVLFKVDQEGRISEQPLDVVKHCRSGLIKTQSHSSPHTTLMSPSGKLFAVCDIGEDRIYMYKIDREREELIPAASPYIDIKGSTVRYCAFHPTLPYFYVNHEGGSMDVLSMRYDEEGRIELIDKTRAVDDTYIKGVHDEQQGFCIHPSGKYLYDVVNGPDVVAVFRVDEGTGKLQLLQNQKVGGEWARGCTISPDGGFLFVTCITSGEVYSFRILEDGTLTPTGCKISQPGASWITFL